MFWRRCASTQDYADPDDMLRLDALGEFFAGVEPPAATDPNCGFDETDSASVLTDNWTGQVELGEDPIATSDLPERITVAEISRIACDLDLDEESLKRAFYCATDADASKYNDAVSGDIGAKSSP